MSRPRPLVAGNWKMNGLQAQLAEIQGIAEGLRDGGAGCDVLVCPPFTLLSAAAMVLDGTDVALGAQDCHSAVSGAHTGDVAAAMLADAGCSHVILGHSERRADHGETSPLIAAKGTAALQAGLHVLLCVGESEAERDAGQTLDVVLGQMAQSLPDEATAQNVTICYEPVWAIGTGRTPTPEDVAQVHQAIRAALSERFGAAAASMRLLYGGSVKPDNAASLMAVPDVDGALVGGASLKAADFLGIIAAYR